jgi:KUP system potassium uptake protein
VLLVGGALLSIDIGFLVANLLKIPHGGWFPLAVGAALFAVFTAWRSGRATVSEQLSARGIPPLIFVGDILSERPPRVTGTAVYMSGNPDHTPPALLHNLVHNQILHERVVFLSVLTESVPLVPNQRRIETRSLGAGVHQVLLHYGFMDRVDVPEALQRVRIEGGGFRLLETTYFLGRESIVPRASGTSLARWQRSLFRLLARNARDAASYFGLPANRVVELGARVEI